MIRIEIVATTGTFNPVGMQYTLESAASAVPPSVPQRVELLDQELIEWEVIDERTATATQQTIVLDVSGDPSRFIAAGSGDLAARLNWFDPGNVLFPAWGVTIDRAIWTLLPE